MKIILQKPNTTLNNIHYRTLGYLGNANAEYNLTSDMIIEPFQPYDDNKISNEATYSHQGTQHQTSFVNFQAYSPALLGNLYNMAVNINPYNASASLVHNNKSMSREYQPGRTINIDNWNFLSDSLINSLLGLDQMPTNGTCAFSINWLEGQESLLIKVWIAQIFNHGLVSYQVMQLTLLIRIIDFTTLLMPLPQLSIQTTIHLLLFI